MSTERSLAFVKRGLCLMMPLTLAMMCAQGPAAPTPGGPVAMVRLRPEPFSFTYNSGLTESQRIVVRTQAAWQEVWASIWRTHSPAPALPEVDFAREMVVVVALGERPTGGFGILIDAASERSNGLELRIRSIAPGPGCGTTQALTQPVDIARVPRRDGEVRFEERQETQECR